MSFFKSLKHTLDPLSNYFDLQREKSANGVKIAEMENAKEIKLAKMEQDQAERDSQRAADEARAERLARYNSGLQDIENGY